MKKTVKKNAVEFVNVLQNAYIARRDFCYANGIESQGKQLESSIKTLTDAVVKTAHEVMNQTDFNAVADIVAQSDKKAGNYEQVKTLVKIADVIRNVSQGISAKSNNFNVCVNSMLLNGKRASRSELVIAQSAKAREGLAHKTREDFTVRSAGYSIGTGDSQASQVMQVLRVLGFTDYKKGETNGVAVMREYGSEMLSRAYLKLQQE